MTRQISNRLQASKFLLQKSGHLAAEIEDAAAFDVNSGRFALADGATEGFDSRNWAKRLVESWIRLSIPAIPNTEFDEWVAGEAKELHESWNSLSLPWYAEEKARAGSFTTFIGLEFASGEETGAWRAVAIGDSCIFKLKSETVVSNGPLFEPSEFGFAPLLMPSNPDTRKSVFDRMFVTSGRLEQGEVLLLLSDALACHLLSDADIPRVNRIISEDIFENEDGADLLSYIDAQRELNKLKDDDVSVVAIRFSPGN